MQVSTGLRNYMLGTGSLKAALNLGFIDFYTGVQPATADSAIGVDNQKICRISVNNSGTGLTLDTPASGVITKNISEAWTGTVLVPGGQATFFRHVGDADDATASTSQPRIQGSIALAGGDINLSSVALTPGATQTLDYYTIALPTL